MIRQLVHRLAGAYTGRKYSDLHRIFVFDPEIRGSLKLQTLEGLGCWALTSGVFCRVFGREKEEV